MKRKSFSLTVVCVVHLLLAFSCKQNVKNDGNTINLDSLQVNVIHHQHNDTTQPACNLQISFVYPKLETDEKKQKCLQSLFIGKTFDEALSILTPQEALEIFSKQYINEFDNFREEEDHEEHEEHECHEDHEHFEETEFELNNPKFESEYHFYLTIKTQVVYNKNNFLSFTVERNIFEGGAHGSNSIYGYVVNLNTGKLINEDLFAGGNYSKNLSALMTQKLAKENGLSSPQDLENIGYINTSDITPNNNFTLNEKGITYYFNEYEIGAYFLGVTKVFIPYEELKIYISENSPISPVITGL